MINHLNYLFCKTLKFFFIPYLSIWSVWKLWNANLLGNLFFKADTTFLSKDKKVTFFFSILSLSKNGTVLASDFISIKHSLFWGKKSNTSSRRGIRFSLFPRASSSEKFVFFISRLFLNSLDVSSSWKIIGFSSFDSLTSISKPSAPSEKAWWNAGRCFLYRSLWHLYEQLF